MRTLSFTITLLLCVLCACNSPKTTDQTAPCSPLPDGFVLLTDIVPDAILEIRYYSTYNFVGTRIDGYEAPVAILTREAAEALIDLGLHLFYHLRDRIFPNNLEHMAQSI